MSCDKIKRLNWIYDLYRLGQTIALNEAPETVRQQILAHIVSGFEAASGVLALTGEDGVPRVVAGVNMPACGAGEAVTPWGGLLGQVIAEGQAILSNNAGPQAAAAGAGWPLLIERRVVGAVAVYRAGGQTGFDADDLAHGQALVNLLAMMIENMRLYETQQKRIETLSRFNQEMGELNHQLATAQSQLLQAEKLASIGQLAAGIAHELNNPIGYVISNLGTLTTYLRDLFGVLDAYGELETLTPEAIERVQRYRETVDVAFLREDVSALMNETLEGLGRVKRIVSDLKDFAHADQPDWEWANLHDTLDSAHNIALNEIKYRAQVRKEYGVLPPVECLPTQMCQVFVNLLVNAAHAMTDSGGLIRLRTGLDADGQVWVEVSDNGRGINAEDLGRIFDPFFTTKPVGQGTGLGLALSYSIVRKHHGRISVDSKPEKGTTFRVTLPVRQPVEADNVAG